MSRFLLILFLSFLLPVTAHAGCAMPNGPDAEAGVIVFNTDHKVMQYCNGDKWIGLRGGKSGGLPSCDDGEITQFSGGKWECNDGSGIDNLNAANLSTGTVAQARLGSGTANNSTYLRGDGTWSAVLANPPTCSGADKALQWSGSAWVCATIEGGGGGPTFDLVNGMHSSEQCTNVGGTVITSGSDKFCRFNGAACPAGWAAYLNWGTYTAKICGPTGCGNSKCTAPAAAWGNTRPSCIYYQGVEQMSGMDSWICVTGGAITCYANQTQIGCY